MRNKPVFGPPQDGQEWVTQDEGAAMVGLTRNYFGRLTKERDYTSFREPHPYAPRWYLKSEVMEWVGLEKMRKGWRRKYVFAGRYPRCTDTVDLQTAQRIFISRKETAALLGVSESMVTSLVYRGRLVSFQTKPGQRGSKMWFSRRSIRQLQEDEMRQKAQVARSKQWVGRPRNPNAGWQGKRLRGISVPTGWLTLWEAARRLGVGWSTVRSMRQRGVLHGERLWRGNKVLKYWYIPEWEIDRLLADEQYLMLRARWHEKQKKGLTDSGGGFASGVGSRLDELGTVGRPMFADSRRASAPIWANDLHPEM